MSARKVLKKNAEVLKKKTLNKQISQMNIRTFRNADSLTLLSSPSEFLPIAMNKQQPIRNEFYKLRQLAAMRRLAYLTNIQCEDFFNFFVVYKNLKNNKWFDDEYFNPKQFDLYLNPVIKKYEGEVQQTTEFCHSFPFFISIVDRYPKVQISYTKITNIDSQQDGKLNGQERTETFEGFKALVIQHCMDHVLGRHFFTPEVSKGRLSIQFGDHFKNTKFLLSQYNLRVKKALQQKKETSEQFKKTQKDYEQRIRQQYGKEMLEAQSQQHKLKFRL